MIKTTGMIYPIDFILQTYKTVQCLDPLCESCDKPAKKNDWRKIDLYCVGYHINKDGISYDYRRSPGVRELEYCANYDKSGNNNLKYSQNYFEANYHPLYYKFFDCKYENCDWGVYCPYVHS